MLLWPQQPPVLPNSHTWLELSGSWATHFMAVRLAHLRRWGAHSEPLVLNSEFPLCEFGSFNVFFPSRLQECFQLARCCRKLRESNCPRSPANPFSMIPLRPAYFTAPKTCVPFSYSGLNSLPFLSSVYDLLSLTPPLHETHPLYLSALLSQYLTSPSAQPYSLLKEAACLQRVSAVGGRQADASYDTWTERALQCSQRKRLGGRSTTNV